jgi:hypothetical protein
MVSYRGWEILANLIRSGRLEYVNTFDKVCDVKDGKDFAEGRTYFLRGCPRDGIAAMQSGSKTSCNTHIARFGLVAHSPNQ